MVFVTRFYDYFILYVLYFGAGQNVSLILMGNYNIVLSICVAFFAHPGPTIVKEDF